MEDLGALTQTFAEALRADGHDHELLHIDGVGGMGAAVEDIHHGDGQPVGIRAAEETVEGDLEGVRRSLRSRDGDREDGVRAEFGLILGAVGGYHGSVDRVGVGGVHTDESVVDDGVDIGDRLGHALAAETLLVAVAQLKRLELARGRTAGSGTSADHAALEHDFRLDGGIAAGVDDLSADDFLDGKILHTQCSPEIIF